ncbi:MAG: hypothetical protein M3220_11950 [Chloroflexota bacterium]|nr:hypothetical protein [Chloroflexota bacterium]
MQNPPRQPLIDEVFTYTIWRDDIHARCRIRIYLLKYKTVVIVSQPPGSSDVSLFTAVEEVATQACEHYGLEPERLVWVVHHQAPHGELVPTEWFDLVTFVWDGEAFQDPEWSPSSRVAVMGLIEEVF